MPVLPGIRAGWALPAEATEWQRAGCLRQEPDLGFTPVRQGHSEKRRRGTSGSLKYWWDTMSGSWRNSTWAGCCPAWCMMVSSPWQSTERSCHGTVTQREWNVSSWSFFPRVHALSVLSALIWRSSVLTCSPPFFFITKVRIRFALKSGEFNDDLIKMSGLQSHCVITVSNTTLIFILLKASDASLSKSHNEEVNVYNAKEKVERPLAPLLGWFPGIE